MTLHKPTWRVVSVLNYISANKGVTLAECSSALGIPVGTLYPILQTLLELEYVSMDYETRKYYPGLSMFLAGSAYISADSGYSSVKSILAKTAERCGGETMHFARLEGGNVLYLFKIESTCSVRTYSAVGSVLPAYGTALGKSLISELSADELRALYPEGLKPITENTITSFEILEAQLEEVRKTGFAYECEESNYDVRCIARPLRKDNRIVAAISVSLPVFRYTDEKRKKIENELSKAGAQMETLLPYILGNS